MHSRLPSRLCSSGSKPLRARGYQGLEALEFTQPVPQLPSQLQAGADRVLASDGCAGILRISMCGHHAWLVASAIWVPASSGSTAPAAEAAGKMIDARCLWHWVVPCPVPYASHTNHVVVTILLGPSPSVWKDSPVFPQDFCSDYVRCCSYLLS